MENGIYPLQKIVLHLLTHVDDLGSSL